MYPVDLPAMRDTDLTSASEEYFSSLESRPHQNEWFPLSQTTEVAISAKHVRRLQLFEDDQPDCTLLALHSPDNPTHGVGLHSLPPSNTHEDGSLTLSALLPVVALYLHEKWWHVDDVLRTSSDSRMGLISVQSLTERVIVYLLSRVVERSPQDKVVFSLHPRTESCKVLWRDGQAVGFYTIKHKGSLCDGCSSHCYLLPALDTVLVRRSWRRRGLGLQMLTDFCTTFSAEPFLGVSSPLSPGMVAVCRSFLQKHQERLEHLYEVEAPGGWTQRRNIWLSIKLGRYSLGVNEERTLTSGETSRYKDDSSWKQASYCSVGPISLTSYSVNTHPAEGSPSKSLGTVCSPAAHAEDPDSGLPTRPPSPRRREKPEEETQSSAKRGRRT